MTLASRLARIYAGRCSLASKYFALPEGADLIMKATHGTTQTRLTRGSEATAKETVALCVVYPSAWVFFSTYARNPEPNVEERLTRALLPRAVCVGAILTTSAEAIALGEHCDETGIIPRRIVIVTDEFNSRRTRDIYRVFFPATKIYIVAVSIDDTYDPESPILNFRNMRRAILWETVIPLIPFWVLTHSGKLGKALLVWMANRIRQASINS